MKCIASDARTCAEMSDLLLDARPAYEGDVVLVEVTSRGGEYQDVEDLNGLSQQLYPGDIFLGVIGNRDSAKYFSSYVPDGGYSVHDQEGLDLLSNGGIIGRADNTPAYLSPPLTVRCLGVLVRSQESVNILPRDSVALPRLLPPIILVGASSTDAGKTTLSSNLIHSLSYTQGMRVASCKLAGTGCLEDVLAHKNAGAQWVRDFPDAGLPSTYTAEKNYVPGVRKILSELADCSPDVILAELGGDLIWANIPALLQLKEVMRHVVRLVMIPADVMGAVGARYLLEEWGVDTQVTWCIPPNRNPRAVGRRMSKYISDHYIDIRNNKEIDALALDISRQVVSHV
ncbi:dethiobiotin synthase [Rathayibacter toxicus]|uniref:dethiobiotin synthase n=1 Tax=Rathayibacter toxicus TaxID=145458 RepID=UPI0011B091F7|nr:dethiobiotin synthase [Rathayibacter toxicus]QOD10069.1 hypothetical protein BSG36_09105 [Rathayibacter toxicus]QWL30830.1 hypothetical protein E2R34_08845 [Rathayibacter toxicus]QWL32929.1 hypothetical protein E2R35_08925 [Rathayibacter toxicus]QWL35023.1 hypothetical protein E2R36_08925 [Rathayibacter toxicus]QWL37154.1 hypothetical protein E2R37_08920 [Rathayibacter toxicus]